MRLRVTVLAGLIISQTLWMFVAPLAALADASGVLISELQTGSTASASDEFVELYNPTASDIDLKGWILSYHAASNSNCTTGWTTKATISSGTVASHGFYLFAATGYLSPDTSFNSGLAAAGGAVRLTDATGQTQDALAWGSGICGNGSPAAAPAAGQSLERRPGADIETGGNAYDTGDNSADFLMRATPDPQSTASPTEDPVSNYTPAPAGSGAASGPGSDGADGDSASGTAPLQLNELLPDPAPPLTDAANEFIEIYNPNATSVNLAGYVIKTGANLTTKHTLPNVTVGPAGYVSLASAVTKIQLANAGSSVALFDPSGQQLGSTVTYGKALTGDAWALDGDTWSWTTTPTPGSPNLITAPSSTAKAAAKSSKAKTAKAKASKSKVVKAAKAKAAKVAKAAKAAVAKLAAPALTAATTPGGHWLLFALAGLTMGYVIYEFRYDVRNFYHRLRGHAKPGRATRSSLKRRGSN